ncbi:MAG TPA: hypothetical protein VHX43_18400 [Xanthobacteraceae bacterium]|jgi:hypothetical protein|nr:hypothetical protein [Xanthobacteraceae bacterium]
MRLKITIGFAALALCAAFASNPAFAQKAANDGGSAVVVAAPAGQEYTPAKPLYNSVRQERQQPTTPCIVGRNPNDGGMTGVNGCK